MIFNYEFILRLIIRNKLQVDNDGRIITFTYYFDQSNCKLYQVDAKTDIDFIMKALVKWINSI